MLNRTITFASLFVLLSILACQGTSFGSGNSSSPADIYLELRTVWFKTKPEDLGIKSEPESKVPYSVLMDMNVDGDLITIASSIVGDGSLLFSTGGGIIGGVEHEDVRKASIHFVEVSGAFVDRMKLSTEFGLPLPGHIKIYVITPSGVYITEELDAETLAGGNHEFSTLFLAGNDVMTELRIANGGQ
ncbi:MAG TPA: hypothetical protein VFR47_19470 [Anaerolineales bacterium]|nr:hypothetical protein [Anaerolineales bacterium]